MKYWMFNRKNSYKPVKPAGHQEWVGAIGRVAFANADGTWEESFNLLEILQKALQEIGLSGERNDDWLIVNNDLYLCPELLSVEPLDSGDVKTVSTMCVAHENHFPNGLFEYQHARGDNLNTALAAGIKHWIELDLPVLLDAINNSLESCTSLTLNPKDLDRSARKALLGPVSHYASSEVELDDEHAFCPCCLLTNSLEAFDQQRNDNAFYGIRLLAVRDENGEIFADCRVNGLDWALGEEQLKKYAETWPGSGFEMRKQYVVMYTTGNNVG